MNRLISCLTAVAAAVALSGCKPIITTPEDSAPTSTSVTSNPWQTTGKGYVVYDVEYCCSKGRGHDYAQCVKDLNDPDSSTMYVRITDAQISDLEEGDPCPAGIAVDDPVFDPANQG